MTMRIVAAVLGALLAGTIVAAAQNSPAPANQQNRSIREELGKPRVHPMAPDSRRQQPGAIRGTQGRGGIADQRSHDDELSAGGSTRERGHAGARSQETEELPRRGR